MSGRICVFGEVLFDHFPDRTSVLGGAPFNVAWHLQAFGLAPLLLSRVGDDNDGATVKVAMNRWGMDQQGLQTDASQPTGRVRVGFAAGEPAYEIVHPSAWDRIAAPGELPACNVLYHGTLALRDPVSRAALEQVRSAGCRSVFMDVNLRPPWWRLEDVVHWLHQADWAKLNQDELLELAPDNPGLGEFLERYRLQGLVLTHGSAGAELLTATEEHYHVSPHNEIKVVDTVGAGDAFSAIMILGLQSDWPLKTTLERAQEFAAGLVGQRGATVADPGFYNEWTRNWGLLEHKS